jgi:periplasmic protein TonB
MRPVGTDVERRSEAEKPGWLNECLIDGDPTAIRSARRARRKAVSVSLALQTGLLATALIVPLFAHVAVPRPGILTPIPPYARGTAEPQRPQQKHQQQSHPGGSRKDSPKITQPPRVPTTIAETLDSSFRIEEVPIMGPEDPKGIPKGIIDSFAPSNPASRQPMTAPPEHAVPKVKPLPRSEILQQAMLVYRVEPKYPPLALQIRLEGTVRLHAIVGRDGVVRDLELLSGHALLAPAALEAVRQWRYRPTILNGEQVEVETYITVIFLLRH